MASGERTIKSFAQPGDEELRRVERADQLDKLAEKFEQLGAVESVGAGLWATEDGRLWRPAPGLPREGGRDPATNAVTVGADLEPIWLARPDGGPRRLAELEKRRERDAKAAERAERERQQALAALRKSAVPVTANLIESGPSMTLAQAAAHIENAGGKLEVKDGRLLVSLPLQKAGGLGLALPAAKRLYLAEQLVFEHLRAKRPLPERDVLPSGALAP